MPIAELILGFAGGFSLTFFICLKSLSEWDSNHVLTSLLISCIMGTVLGLTAGFFGDKNN